MPKQHISVSYTFDELSETAQGKAVEAIREKLASSWWDQDDNDQISETIVGALAEQIKTPTWDQYGVSDFPGIPGVKLVGWSVDRDDYVAFEGQLTRDNAPGLNWPNGVDYVELDSTRSVGGTNVTVYFEWTVDPADRGPEAVAVRSDFEQAVRDCLSEALSAGRKEVEYKTSADYARDSIEANEPDFTEDGDLF